MKSLVYITKDKVWFGEKGFNWTGDDLIKVFQAAKKDDRITDLRILLGDGVSYVAGFKWEKQGEPTRDEVLTASSGWMPFVVEDSCFDWRKSVRENKETWIQVVGVEKSFLETVTRVVKQSGMRVELMIPASILIGEKAKGGDNPTMIKWQGKENMTILVVNGLVDMVSTTVKDEEISAYAKHKWNLAVNPEQVIVNDKNFNILEAAFSEKTRGDDKEVMSISLLQGPITSTPVEKTTIGGIVVPEEVAIGTEVVTPPIKKMSDLLIGTVVVFLMVIFGIMVWYFFIERPKVAGNYSGIQATISPVSVITPTVSATAVPTMSPAELSKYNVDVLNGSGITGEAARIKTVLLGMGFVNIDTGNSASPSSLTTISYKSSVPESIVSEVTTAMGNLTIGAVNILTSDDKYDLIIVVGSAGR